MGRELLTTEPVFRDAIERCDRAMRPYGDWSILKELEAADASRSRLGEIDVLQPALFAIQIALAALWRSWGIEPHVVVGHSMGEVAAAHVAGALSLDDAVRVICTRSRLVKPTIGRGAMAAVDLSIADSQRAIAGYEDRVSIAVSNGPTSTVLSGDPAALETIVARLQSRDIFGRMIKVDFAAHSPDMEPLRADLKRALEGIQPQHPSIALYSTVTGRDAEDLALDPDYWSRNLREPVLFSSAVEQLLTGGHDIFLEISPHPILLSAIQQEFSHTGLEGAAIPSLRRDEQENKVLTSSLGALYTTGYPIEWNRIYTTEGQSIQLPPTHGSANDSGWIRRRLSRAKLAQASIRFSATISNPRNRKLTTGTEPSTAPCPISTTTVSKASRCCPPRSTSRWPWPLPPKHSRRIHSR